jgi:hypothetical protein
VFQGRYKALLVDHDRYLLALVRYIHLNPVKAGLVARPEAYRWSSHRAYLGMAAVPWLSPGPALRYYGERVGESRRRFKTFVDEAMPEEGEELALGEAEAGALLPVEGFLPDHEKGDRTLASFRPSIDEVCRLVCEDMRIKPSELAAPSRVRPLARARHVISFLTLELGAGTLGELAGRFRRDPAALHRGIQRIKKELGWNADLRRTVTRLSDGLQ